jgi:hypothetical protein
MNRNEGLAAPDNMSPFERIRRTNASGAEYWPSREFAQALGYTKYRNFDRVMRKAKRACIDSGKRVEDHFVDAMELIELGKGSRKPAATVWMSRYACHLILQNTDPSKKAFALAQRYFKTSDKPSGASPESLPRAENTQSAPEQQARESRIEAYSDNGAVERNTPRWWIPAERLVLVLTFICTGAGTIYSVGLARKTLNQMGNELRPWVIIPQVDSHFKASRMETKFQITNIGKIPAFYTVTNEAYYGTQADAQLAPKRTESLIVIMPGQTIWVGGYGIKGEAYEKIRKKGSVGNFVQGIRVSYGQRKSNFGKYWTYLKVIFDANDVPSAISSRRVS